VDIKVGVRLKVSPRLCDIMENLKLKINSYFPKKSAWVFLLLFITLFFVYDFQHIAFYSPQSVHQWRQCDCLSFSLNYFQDNNSFWQPQMNYLGNDNSGKTVSDFPLIYYSVAQLWKIFGRHEFIFRFLVLFIAFCGLFALFRTIERLFKDSFWGLFISLMLFSSTIFVYYSFNFLMNVPAFGLALVALYFFYRFAEAQNIWFWILSLLFFLLAGLLKIPALTSFMAIFLYFLAEKFGFVPLKYRIFSSHKYIGLSFLVLFIPIFAWYFYAAQYNKQHNQGIFLIGILPIWDYSWENIKHVIKYAHILWFKSYHSPISQYLSALMLVFLIIKHKKWNFRFKFLTINLALGFFAYIILWFQVFDNHDYYLINQLIFMLFILVSFLYYLKQNHPKFFSSHWLKIAAVLLLTYNIHLCQKNLHVRYHGWPNKKYVEYYKAFEEIKPLLYQLNIMPDDKVLVYEKSKSFNIALYLMNRKGWTNAVDLMRDSNQVAEKISAGAKYLFVSDSIWLQKDFLQPYLKHSIGKYKNIRIFDLGKEE